LKKTYFVLASVHKVAGGAVWTLSLILGVSQQFCGLLYNATSKGRIHDS